ncbi:MAG TPA: hypothetical protein ENN63_08345 [Bacteroidetes bacterium]|nr:hypothetical protein [Bacteroidota bacterium]
MKKIRDFLFNVGFHCVLLGILGIFAIIVFGCITCIADLPPRYFYIALAVGLACGIIASICCIRKNCSLFKKDHSS